MTTEVPSKAALAVLIGNRLATGCLPHNSIPRVWGSTGGGERCDACDQAIDASTFCMEGIGDEKRSWQFHVTCFYVWDVLRRPPGDPRPAWSDAAGEIG
jgi:hypothetical protein